VAVVSFTIGIGLRGENMNLVLEVPPKYPRGGAKQAMICMGRSTSKQNEINLAGKPKRRITSMILTALIWFIRVRW